MLTKIESLINSGRYFEAHNMAEELCRKEPDNLRAHQLCGLSMSKSGARKEAISFLEPLLQSHNTDPETAGILGGVYKELFKVTAESSYARKSLETYLSNFEVTNSYYTGINAATMSQILGRGSIAREVAEKVVAIATKEESFWAYATVGEANLLLRNSTAAIESYYKAVQIGESQYGKLGSVYSQLLILQHYINVPEEVLAMFAPPKVAVFAGHMIDHNRDVPRFPEDIADQIKFAIGNELRINNIKVGYSSLASGSDILFVESLIELGGEVNIFIPFDRDEFIDISVAVAGKDWVERFEKIEATQDIRYISKEHCESADILFDFLGKVMIGSGVMRATLFHDQPYLLTVASEVDTTLKTGGTNSMRSLWPYTSNMLNINPDLYVNQSVLPSVGSKADLQSSQALKSHDKNIRYFVLATLLRDEDAVSDDKRQSIIDKVKAEFIEFPGYRRAGVSDDGIYALYTKAHYAMDFALRLLNWSNDANIGVRIAMEAILLAKGHDPHEVISETSSLKSLAFSDACYATMQFAAALSAEQPGRYDFHHVGIISVGKIDEGQEIYKIDNKLKTALS